jgi:hypothetical protein
VPYIGIVDDNPTVEVLHKSHRDEVFAALPSVAQ